MTNQKGTPAMNTIYRQGDVLLVATDKPVPRDAQRVERDAGRVVLAYGEVTGHAHAIHDLEADLYEHDALEIRFLAVLAGGGVDLTHEEHATIHLPAGTYKVIRQREYAPEGLRNVAD